MEWKNSDSPNKVGDYLSFSFADKYFESFDFTKNKGT